MSGMDEGGLKASQAVKDALGEASGYGFEDIGAGSFGGAPNYRLSYG